MHERQVLVGEHDLDAAPGLDAVEHLQHEVVDRPVARLRSGGAGLEPREVEEVAHDPVEPLRLAEDRLGELAAVVGIERELAVRERAGRGEDRHQRRAEVVAHRAQERRLQRVAAAQGLGLEGLRRQPLAFVGQLAQRLQGRLRLLGAPPRPGGELADDDGGDEEDEQREPVARVLQCQRVERRQEEEVEREHARDRHADRVDDPPGDRDRDDRRAGRARSGSAPARAPSGARSRPSPARAPRCTPRGGSAFSRGQRYSRTRVWAGEAGEHRRAVVQVRRLRSGGIP